MVERKRINILYYFNESWIGGVYYVTNIIKALKYLPIDKMPEIRIYHWGNDTIDGIKSIEYPSIEFVQFKIPLRFRIVNKIIRIIGGVQCFLKRSYGEGILSNLFLANIETSKLSKIKQPVFWIPDFQEKYLPEFFSQETLSKRESYNQKVAQSQYDVVFSSFAAKADFELYYPGNRCKKHVLQFVSIIDLDVIEHIDKLTLFDKYSIGECYFIVCNQFWIHKNHQVVLDAVKVLVKEQPDFKLVFTGREFDSRWPNYTSELKSFVRDNNLESNIKFLGFIDRYDQLALMRYAKSVIQPSFFEGWSTVVEDCKALGKHIVLSDIPVHKEQISENVTFFDPYNASELATILLTHREQSEISPSALPMETKRQITKFANDFISIFE